MKIAKRLTACFLALVTALLLTSCGGGGGKEIDLDALAGELTASAAFTADMTQFQTSGAAIAGTYGFDESEVTKSCMYYNTSTAEEIFLAQAADSKGAEHLQQLCQTRLEAQTAWLQSYLPEAVPRLENAVLVTSGNYVMLVVANDSAAAKGIVEKYTK